MEYGRRRIWAIVPAWLLALSVVTFGFGDAAGQGPPQNPNKADPGKPGVAPVAPSSLDEPLAWLREGKRNYGAVKDYTCTLWKKENINGKISEDHIIQFKFREQPFSVAMRWQAPRANAGTEAIFVTGKNNNKMRVHAKGIKGLAGWVSIDVNDNRVFENSRHNIIEAGIGNLLDQTIKLWEKERPLDKTQVKVAEYKYNNRLCLRIETTRTERRQEFYCYRSVLYIDKESKIPIRSECYDWPHQGGQADGELMEMFSFVDLRFNVGLTDRDFDK